MINKAIFSFLIVLLLVFSCYAQQTDVPGWQNARWGMTESQLLETFKTEIKKLPERKTYNTTYADYSIPDFEINGQKYEVFFQMAKETNKLSQVLIRSSETTSLTPNNVFFDDLEALLTRKYGAAAYKKDDKSSGRVSLKRQWTFPTTTIVLSYWWTGSDDFSLLAISYFPTSKELDKI